jgi:hypothetical protein
MTRGVKSLLLALPSALLLVASLVLIRGATSPDATFPGFAGTWIIATGLVGLSLVLNLVGFVLGLRGMAEPGGEQGAAKLAMCLHIILPLLVPLILCLSCGL